MCKKGNPIALKTEYWNENQYYLYTDSEITINKSFNVYNVIPLLDLVTRHVTRISSRRGGLKKYVSFFSLEIKKSNK